MIAKHLIRTAMRGLTMAALLWAAGTAASPAWAQDAGPTAPAPDGAQPPPAIKPPQAAPSQPTPSQQAPSPDAAPSTVEQRDKILTELYARLAVASSAAEAEPITASIEHLWQVSGSPTADLLLNRAVAAKEAGDQDLAMKLLDATVLLQPDYVEAWNRRAYLYYSKNDLNRALGDLRRVLALEPNHFRALEGLGQILRNIGEKRAALEAYRKLLAVHPQASGARQALDELKLEVEGQGI